MLLLTHPTGNANVRNALLAFEEAGLLGGFSTTLAVPQSSPVLTRRSYPIPWKKVTISPWRECLRLTAGRFSPAALPTPETGWASIDQVYRALDRRAARLLTRPSFKGVYAYEDGALACLRAAKAMGKAAIYELPIVFGPHARKILTKEAERRPEWAFTLGGLNDSEEKMLRKRAELEAADLIITPSQFVLDSIPAAVRSSRSCEIVPYGADPAIDSHEVVEHCKSSPVDRPLRLLFVGSFSQRKGLADVLEACSKLNRKDVELHLLGSPMAPMPFYRQFYPGFVYHPPCSRGDVLKTMLACDLLLLPSLVEGRALVQLEALSCGLPIIITPNTGGDDLLVEGKTGWKVAPSAPDQLAERFEWIADNRDCLPEMHLAALAMARANSWSNYRRKLQIAVRPLL